MLERVQFGVTAAQAGVRTYFASFVKLRVLRVKQRSWFSREAREEKAQEREREKWISGLRRNDGVRRQRKHGMDLK
jgi:hypothetical protein